MGTFRAVDPLRDRRGLPPPRLTTAAHAGTAGGRARARTVGFRLAVRPGAHLVERRLARRLVLGALATRTVGHALVVERDPHLVERGLVHLAASAGGRTAGAR